MQLWCTSFLLTQTMWKAVTLILLWPLVVVVLTQTMWKAVTLILLWPLVVVVIIQQLDVDKLQMRIAIATLSWLHMQPQDCGPHVCTHTIQLSVMTCPPTLSNCQWWHVHPHYPTVSDDMSTHTIQLSVMTCPPTLSNWQWWHVPLVCKLWARADWLTVNSTTWF